MANRWLWREHVKHKHWHYKLPKLVLRNMPPPSAGGDHILENILVSMAYSVCGLSAKTVNKVVHHSDGLEIYLLGFGTTYM